MKGRTGFDRRHLLTFGILSRRRKVHSADGCQQEAQHKARCKAAAAPQVKLDLTGLFGPRVELRWRSLLLAAGFSGTFLAAALQLSTLALLVAVFVATIVVSCTAGIRPSSMQSTNGTATPLATELFLRMRGAASGLVVGGLFGLAACLFWLHGYVAAFGLAFPLQLATSCGVALGAFFPRLFGLPAALVCVVLQMLI